MLRWGTQYVLKWKINFSFVLIMENNMGKNSELRDIPYGSPILAMATCVFGWMMDVKHNIFESAYVWESDIFWTFFERA